MTLHAFAEEIERLLMMVLLVFFGAAIADGAIFTALDWRVIVAALLILFVVRPACAWLSIAWQAAAPETRAAVSFFGIRGLGSFYYVAFALGEAPFERTETVWVAVSCVVLASIVLHGTTVTPVMARLDRRRKQSR